MATYEFAIIRVCPDPRRGELVNIGLAIFVGGEIDTRILPSLSKVQALHADFDIGRLYGLGVLYNKLSSGFDSVDQRYSAIKNVGVAQLSERGRFVASDQVDYEGTVKSLMSKLVIPTVQKRTVQKRSKLYASVKASIEGAGILGSQPDDIYRGLVVPRFPIAEEQGLYADFALKNGVYRLTEVIDFNVSGGLRANKLNEAGLSAVKLHEAKEKFGRDSLGIVIYAASSAKEREVGQHLRLLGQFSDMLLNFESASDRAAYVEEMVKAARHGLPLQERQAQRLQ